MESNLTIYWQSVPSSSTQLVQYLCAQVGWVVLNRTGTLSRCKAYTTLDTSNLPTLNLHYSVWTHIIIYSGKYPALPWLSILLHPASNYSYIVYTMLPKHIPPCLNLKLSCPCVWFKSGWNDLPQGPKWHRAKNDSESDCQDQNILFSSVHCQTSTTLMTSLVNTHIVTSLLIWWQKKHTKNLF